MTYDEVQSGQRVRIVVPTPKFRATGTVKSKAREQVAGRVRERVYVDTDVPRGRRVVVPGVLEVLR